MKTLSTEHRRQLERTVVEARDIAEAGARGALEAFAVHHHEPYGHMNGEQRKLRNRLRAHARHLGDRVDARSGAHAIDHLIHECAYEHWHGMLFARFLAENQLLIEPEMGVAITLDECEELAKEEGPHGKQDKWALAARFAHRMLPQVFRPDHPVFEVQFAREYRLRLESLVEALPEEVFTATDALGWVYQFWQTKKKDEVNRSEVKIGADELPAVTQLFTEPYMVQFLLHNSLGAWWVSRHPKRSCPVELTYLCILPSPSGRGAGGEGDSPLPPGEGPGVRARYHDIPPEHIAFARELRKTQTDAEQLLWSLLRNRRLADCKFRRQHPLGPYVLDFYCHEKKLAIELDGGQHNEPDARARDEERTGYINKQGICVVRFWNNQVMQETEAVLQAIWNELMEEAPSPQPLSRGERGLNPAAGAFEAWPDDLAEFRLLDPCCGSGHFLVAAFLMLVPMRMALEGLNAAEAVDAVLRENIHGLELDQRCVAIAAFALALEAWRFPDAGGFRTLPKLNLAWCGQPVAGKREQWLALAEGDSRLEAGMTALYDTFRDAPILGSLIDPARSVAEDMLTAGFEEVAPLLGRALREHAGDEEWEETTIAALGLADAARLLSGHYHLVITNVPYLTRGKQNERLRKFAETHYAKARNDLANVFLERCLELSLPEGAGVTQIVMPQNWLFLTSYKGQREHLLQEVRWDLLARLGPGAFDTISGEVVNVILLTLTRTRPLVEDHLHGIDASVPRTAAVKAEVLRDGEILAVSQKGQLGNPDARIALGDEADLPLLKGVSEGLVGLQTGDDPRFCVLFWELPRRDSNSWEFLQNTPDVLTGYSGLTGLVRWDNGRGPLLASSGARPTQGLKAVGQVGVAIHRMRVLFPYHFSGTRLHQNVAVIVPREPQHLPALWCFCSSPEYNEAVRRIDQKLNVTNATLVKVPFDLDHWTKVAAKNYPNGLPKPYSDDPTQWIFHGHPCGSVVWDEQQKKLAHGPLRADSTVLQVAVARLLGYHWPAELDPGMELADEQREWVERAAKLSSPTPDTRHPTPLIDDDGIVCIPSVRGERPAHERLLQLLHTAYGEKWNDGILSKLLAESGSASLDDWLRNQFFDEHCKLFQHRPFIWHIWDGRKRDGFHALVNYHKIAGSDFGQPKAGPKGEPQGRSSHKLAEGNGNKGRRLMESLTYSYLGDWIARQQDGVKRGEGGAEDRLAAALELQKRLVAILEGEPPFDVFVRWKPIEEQPIGWEPDINDGVRLNIRPFMAQDIPGGKKGAGILRARPNIHWNKDRGKEPTRDQAEFPWFWKNGKFTGERVNDVHLTNAEKRAAREKAGGKQT